ncbi:tetratricopeptide repeat protein [uncultured Brevundimonas sp.]|mgnify:CR=1 FL=1|uniref:tetratricopeptide repeat protein n=1 Tax=uncultured Brevundimonas sp. TaxID=213418 RepID=UPI0030EFA132
MVDVFEQVEEELRSDRYKRLARTWLPVAGGVLLLALIAALAWWGWQSWQTSQGDKASAAYDHGMEALESTNPVGADTAFTEAAAAGTGGYKALALMQRAGIAVTANKIPEAIALFDEAARASRDPIISDPAALKAAWLVMDTGDLADIEKRLEPLTAEGRPLRPFAREALALARLQHGKIAEARDIFVLLQRGLDVPDPIKQRAQVAISAIDAGTAANLAAIVRAQAAVPATPAPAPADPNLATQ